MHITSPLGITTIFALNLAKKRQYTPKEGLLSATRFAGKHHNKVERV